MRGQKKIWVNIWRVTFFGGQYFGELNLFGIKPEWGSEDNSTQNRVKTLLHDLEAENVSLIKPKPNPTSSKLNIKAQPQLVLRSFLDLFYNFKLLDQIW